MQSRQSSRRIHVLREAEVRKIAAGEVIDRPLSVVRELIDNSIDSGADEISVYVNGGGVERIRVVDNGIGMTPEDLEICILPHATSKIAKTEDIYSVDTLGFRGEALSSIASCSKLEITSTYEETPEEGRSINVHAGKLLRSSPAPARVGTTVEVSDLFYSLPGRRKFLKRVSSESQGCKQAFIEKALPFPEITFRYFSDNDLKLYLPAQSAEERVAAVFPRALEPKLLDSGETEFNGASIKVVLTKPGFTRRDRRLLYVFVNRRRIQEFALLQAVTYGYSEHLPGGSYPAAFVCIDIDPHLVDFNIHPAKREVRFKDLQIIHRGVVDLVRSVLSNYRIHSGAAYEDRYRQESVLQDIPRRYSPEIPPNRGLDHPVVSRRMRREPADPPRSPSASYTARQGSSGGSFDLDSVRAGSKASENLEADAEGILYHGQVFGLFLLAEYDETLYIIDQHAAHERIIYEKLIHGSKEVQSLLVPVKVELEEDEEEALLKDLDTYKNLGFSFEREGPGLWLLTACPAVYLDLKEEIVASIKGRKGDTTSLEQELYARISCRAAVMDGEILDDLAGFELARKALALKNARCPHGRPIWHKISREDLFAYVLRT